MDPTNHDQPRRLHRGAVWGAASAVVLAGIYVGAHAMLSDRVPTGTSVLGIDLGGMRSDEAKSHLAAGVAALMETPIALIAGEQEAMVSPAEAGLGVDVLATIDDLTGFSLRPGRLIAHLSGTHEPQPVTTIDRDLLAQSASRAAELLTTSPIDGSVWFDGETPVVSDAVHGALVDQTVIEEHLIQHWPALTSLTLPYEQLPPQVTQDATVAAYELAHAIASGPVVVEVGSQRPQVPVSVLVAATSFEAVDGTITPIFDGEVLLNAVLDRLDHFLDEPNNAYFAFVDGAPVIMGGEPGTTLDEVQLMEAVKVAAVGADRRAVVNVVEDHPEITRASLEALGVNEIVSSFSTSLTPNATRTANIARGAELINERLVLPGEEFSLLGALNPIDAANGFGRAPVIIGGMLQNAVGGGLSQLATTIYNASFFAGFETLESRPHSFHINLYPPGREATIVQGSLDNRWRNNSPYGALIQAWVSGGQLHIRIWSTEHFRVETWASGKSNIRPAEMRYNSHPDCVPSGKGQPGFSITNFRRVWRGDQLVIDEVLPWTYNPDHGVRCI